MFLLDSRLLVHRLRESRPSLLLRQWCWRDSGVFGQRPVALYSEAEQRLLYGRRGGCSVTSWQRRLRLRECSSVSLATSSLCSGHSCCPPPAGPLRAPCSSHPTSPDQSADVTAHYPGPSLPFFLHQPRESAPCRHVASHLCPAHHPPHGPAASLADPCVWLLGGTYEQPALSTGWPPTGPCVSVW